MGSVLLEHFHGAATRVGVADAAFPHRAEGYNLMWFTRVRSPEPNGIAEAFVKTFKRDYVRLDPRPDAVAVMAALDFWFEDYNEMQRHRAIGMRSPRQFIREQQPAACPA